MNDFYTPEEPENNESERQTPPGAEQQTGPGASQQPQQKTPAGPSSDSQGQFPPMPPSYPNYGYDPSRFGRQPDGQRPYQPPQYQAPPQPGSPYQPPQPQYPIKYHKGMSTGGKVFLTALCSAVFLFAAAFGLYGMYKQASGDSGTTVSQPHGGQTSSAGTGSQFSGTSSGQSSSDGSFQRPQYNGQIPVLQLESADEIQMMTELTPKQIGKKVRPSVVGVLAYAPQDGRSIKVGEGSGIIMTEDGFIITNAHVIINAEYEYDPNDLRISVVTLDNEEYTGFVMGYDTRTDLAVIKVDAHDLPPAEFGDSDMLEVGDFVVAIGNPGGLEYAGSMTRGIVSALNRMVTGVSASIKLIQVDAAINPGNSGGALVNEYGKVVGINSAKLVSTSYEGMGFSIPITQAKPIIDDLLQYGYVSGRVRIGITCSAISQAEAEYNKVPQGLLIRQIASDSSLANTEIKEGDIITHFSGNALTRTEELFTYLGEHRAGDAVTLTIYQPQTGRSVEVSVTLMEDTGQK